MEKELYISMINDGKIKPHEELKRFHAPGSIYYYGLARTCPKAPSLITGFANPDGGAGLLLNKVVYLVYVWNEEGKLIDFMCRHRILTIYSGIDSLDSLVDTQDHLAFLSKYIPWIKDIESVVYWLHDDLDRSPYQLEREEWLGIFDPLLISPFAIEELVHSGRLDDIFL